MKTLKKRYFTWIFVGALVIFIALTCRVTIIPDEKPVEIVNEAGETVIAEKLSPMEQYCIDHWDSRIYPAVQERAVELATFVKDALADLDAAGKTYGNRANETSPWSFCVGGEARVLEIENADKPNKTNLILDVAPFDGAPDCKIHFGKVFPSNIKNAVRDGVGFLKLDDFANQVEFADLTTAFNNRIKNEIILPKSADDFSGQKVRFWGCISLQDTKPESMVIIPIELNVVEE